MILDDQSGTFYDVLDVKPDASPEEIRDAYLKTKAAYSKDSVALYTLVSQEEMRDMLHRIEEAYQVLSHPQRRREYDAHHGIIDSENDRFARTPRPLDPSKKIISIDRVPPMDTAGPGEDLLVAPATDFGDGRRPSAILERVSPAAPHSAGEGMPPELEQEILDRTDWTGEFLRRVREGMRLSIEEMATTTKISKTYLGAIEDEEFSKLPAAVYVRGFVMQIAKILKLPHDKVAASYMERFKKVRP